MIKLLHISILCLSCLGIFAQSPMERFEKANELYQSKEFEAAIEVYESLLSEGKVSADLHYNLANAHYRNRELAIAILHYEKALKLEPNMADARHNLEFANSRTVDKVESPPKLFFYRWWDSLIHLCSCNDWGLLSILFLALFTIGLGLYFFLMKAALKKLSFYTSIACLVLFLLSWLIAAQNQNSMEESNYAIILSPTVNINSSPSEGSSKLFVLHEGTKVKLGDQSDEWREISLPNGNEGWVKLSVLGEI